MHSPGERPPAASADTLVARGMGLALEQGSAWAECERKMNGGGRNVGPGKDLQGLKLILGTHAWEQVPLNPKDLFG